MSIGRITTEAQLAAFVRAELARGVAAPGLGTVLRGTGSPENVVAAPPGVEYQRDDGGAGTSLYVKESAASLRTGWRAI